MIKRLKWQFMLTFMFFVTIVLMIIHGSFYYISANQSETLHSKILNQAIGLETTIDSRIINNYNLLIVEINAPLNKVTFLSNQWDRSNAQIKEMIDYVTNQTSDYGKISQLNIQYARRSTPFTTTIAFLDLAAASQSLSNITTRSIIMAVIVWFSSWLIARFLANRSIAPIEKSMAVQQQLVANLSHELKNPLAVISANTQILSNTATDTQAKWLGFIQDETARMNDLIGQMLYLSQSDEQQSQLKLEPIELSELLLGVVLPFESIAYENKMTLNIKNIDQVTILGQPTVLKQVISILTDNAFKFAYENGKIEVSLTHKQNSAIIQISNTGVGISKDDLPHIFERFYRGDPARSSKGYGLGLSLAKLMVEQHHGTISVTSIPNAVTTFTITLPVYKKRNH